MLVRLKSLSPAILAALIALGMGATLVGAWIFQYYGYAPCELCLKQRIAYYYGVPLALLTLGFSRVERYRGLAGAGFVALALLFGFNSLFGLYHSGVEWGWWPGPSECTGAVQKANSMSDFMKQLDSVKVVRCDAVALRILGLSLAGWNCLISAAASFAAVLGARKSLRFFE